MTEPPTPSELDRRVSELVRDQRAGFSDLNKRLDAFPTEQTIIALFEVRDGQIKTLQERGVELSREVDELRRTFVRDLNQERRDRENADKENERKALEARRWATTTMIAGAVAVASLLGFFIRVMGGTA